MPELPEVETVRRGLLPVMEGKRLLEVEQRRPDLRWPFPERFAERLSGTRIERLRRRSKYILADLGSGEILLIHLGMTGRMLIEAGRQTAPGVFAHAIAMPAKHAPILRSHQVQSQHFFTKQSFQFFHKESAQNDPIWILIVSALSLRCEQPQLK